MPINVTVEMSEKMHTRIQAMAQSFSMPFDAMVLILLSRSLAFEEDEHQRIKNLLMGEKIKQEFTKDDDKLEIEAPRAQCKELGYEYDLLTEAEVRSFTKSYCKPKEEDGGNEPPPAA